MSNWQYTDETKQIVFRPTDTGGTESCLTTAIQEWLDAGNTPDPAPSVNPIPLMVEAIQLTMDTKAQALGYDDLKTAITYRGDPNPKFAAEADGFFTWRSSVWTEAYARMAAGNIPASPADAVALMPALQITYPV